MDKKPQEPKNGWYKWLSAFLAPTVVAGCSVANKPVVDTKDESPPPARQRVSPPYDKDYIERHPSQWRRKLKNKFAQETENKTGDGRDIF